MMQVAGKNNSHAERILSIHLLVGGLSFFCSAKNKYSTRALAEGSSLTTVIQEEVGGEGYDMINIYHNSLDYIIIPKELYEHEMADAYLMTKGITATDDNIIQMVEVGDIVFLSCTMKVVHADSKTPVNTLPVIAKAICHSMLSDDKRVSYILQDDKLHVAVAEKGALQMAESFPLVGASDVDFFLSSVHKKYATKRANLEFVALYESGDYALSKSLKEKYKVEVVGKENFLNI